MMPARRIRPTSVPNPPPLGAGAGPGDAGAAEVSLPAVLVSAGLLPSAVDLLSAAFLSAPAGPAAGAAPGDGSTTAVTSGSGTAMVCICWPLGRSMSTSFVVVLLPAAVT